MSFNSPKESETIFRKPENTDEKNGYNDSSNDVNDANKKYTDLEAKDTDGARNYSKKYPKYVFLIILNEFCERFSYYGIRTVMFIFLTSKKR